MLILALPLAMSVGLSRINSSQACVCTFIDTLSESPGALIKIPGLANPNQPDFNSNRKV